MRLERLGATHSRLMKAFAMPSTARLLTLTLASCALLSGCAQIGGAADAVWGGTKSVARFVYSPVKSLLRDAPEQDVRYVETNPYAGADVTIYDPSAVQATVLPDTYAYSDGTAYTPAPQVGRIIDTPQRFRPAFSQGYYATPAYEDATNEPLVARVAAADSLAFVKLNGDSSMRDWQTCENLHMGYWLIDAAGGRIDPKFESCMRNKGYVLESELALYGLNGQTPVTAPRSAPGGYAYP